MSVEKEMTCDECLFPDKMGCITASNTACAIGRAYAEKVAECEKLEKDNDNLRRTIHLLNDTGCPCGVNVDVLKSITKCLLLPDGGHVPKSFILVHIVLLEPSANQ